MGLLKTRLFLEQDLPGLLEMVFSFYHEIDDYYAELISAEKILRTVSALTTDPFRGKIVILEMDGQTAGYAILIYYWSNEFGGEMLFIDELFVKPAWRRQGVARAFLRHLEQSETVYALQLEVNPANTAAFRLYETAGFSELPKNRSLFKLGSKEMAPQARPDNGEPGQLLILTTARLCLKVIDESDAGFVLDFFERNRGFLRQWEPARPAEFFTYEYQRKGILNDLLSMRRGTKYQFWLFRKGESSGGRVIGSVCLNNIVRGCFQSCFLGYRMDESEINRGYMTEALRRVIDFAFSQLGLHRIEANIIPRNLASLRVAQKLNFLEEGLARRYLHINGKWEDHLHMVLLNEG